MSQNKNTTNEAYNGIHGDFTDPNNGVSLYYQYTRTLPLLTIEEEIDIALKIKERKKGWKDALTKGVEANVRLVFYITNKVYRKLSPNQAMDFMDAVQEGMRGLTHAWLSYDPYHSKNGDKRKGPYRFSTYGGSWILQYATRGINNQLNTIRIPVHINDDKRKISNHEDILLKKYGRAPTLEEIAEAVNLPIGELKRIRNAHIVGSIDEKFETGEYKSNYIQDKKYPEKIIIKNLENEDRKKQISDILLNVSRRADKILRLRFGMTDDQTEQTLEEVAKKYHISRIALRKIESAALRKLRKQ